MITIFTPDDLSKTYKEHKPENVDMFCFGDINIGQVQRSEIVIYIDGFYFQVLKHRYMKYDETTKYHVSWLSEFILNPKEENETCTNS